MNIRGARAGKGATAPGKFARDEKGQILVIVLCFLVLGAIMITPLLAYMMTGLRATEVYQKNNLELYAADAGVKDAMWCIENVVTGLPRLPTDPALQYHPANVNDQSVTVTITCVDTSTYRILSVGGTSSPTTIECYVSILNFNDLSKNGASSRDSITIQPGTTINGDVQAPTITNKGTINGNTSNDPVTNWPTDNMLTAFYGKQVDKSNPFAWDTMDASNPLQTGPVYRQGDLTISGTGTLTGTIYVTGNLSFANSASVDLGGQTIFVEGNVEVGTHVTVIGIGCVIALGDIKYWPNTNRSGDFVFVMSVDHGVDFQPQGGQGSAFNGSVAGNQNVYFHPGCTLTHPPVPPLNYPGVTANIITGVKTWKVTPPMNLSLNITTGSLSDGWVHQAYSDNLTASGGTSPYTWSVAAGSLPDGLSLSSAGAISGTPTTSGTFSFTVRVTDSVQVSATAALSITVTGLYVDTSSLPDGYVDEAYSQTLLAAVGTVPYTWSLVGGSLPGGLALASSGVISGTPTTAGSSSFIVRVTDNFTPTPATAAKALSITIRNGLNVATASLANGWTSQTYSDNLSATGGTPPYVWSRTAGSLPAGLALSADGAISGTPTDTGTYSFTVTVTDNSSPTHRTASKALSIIVAEPPAVSTNAATSVGKTSAVLNGTLTDLGSAGGSVTLYFQWGTDTSYSRGTIGANPGSWNGAVPEPYNDTLSGLTHHTTYHYRAYVVASDGAMAYGADRTFTTTS